MEVQQRERAEGERNGQIDNIIVKTSQIDRQYNTEDEDSQSSREYIGGCLLSRL